MALARKLRNLVAATALAAAPTSLPLAAQTYTQPTVTRTEQFTLETRLEPLTVAGVVGTNALVGGISTGLRTKETGGSFWKGFLYGALGGTLAGSAKTAVGYNPSLAWPARITNALGSSIADNIAHGRSPLERFTMGVGPFRVELEQGKPQLYLEAVSTLGAAYFLARGCSFDANRSLGTGSLVFTSKNGCFPEFDAQGVAFGNTIGLRETPERRRERFLSSDGCRFEMRNETRTYGFHSTFGHELVHTFQAEHAYVFPLLGKPLENANEQARDLGIDVGTTQGVVFSLVSLVVPRDFRPHESEATMLAHHTTKLRYEYTVKHIVPEGSFSFCPPPPTP